jgi:hypothetical protein
MRFTDFLKATILISAGAATALAAITVARVSDGSETTLIFVAAAWWIVAAGYGIWVGRGTKPSASMARLLAAARTSPALPEVSPGRVLLNRLWPLLVVTVAAAGLALLFPQVPAIGAGFAILGALALRNQEKAVTAIEDRDGVRFYVDRTSPLRPIELLRTPGLTAIYPSPNGAGDRDVVLRRP